MPRYRTVAILPCVLAAALGLGACSSSESGGPDSGAPGSTATSTSTTATSGSTAAGGASASTRPSPSSSLMTALGQVPSSVAGQVVTYGRPLSALSADGGSYQGPYSVAAGYGTGFLGTASRLDFDALGFDPLQASYAITAGRAPRDATLLAGIRSTPQVATKAKSYSPTVTRTGTQTVYRFRGDNSVGTDDPLGEVFGGTLSPNLLSVAGQELRYARSSAGLATVSANENTLAGETIYTSVASCLGDPLAARIASHDGVELLAVGISGGAGTKPTEQLCAVAASAAAASTLASKIRAALAGGTSRRLGRKWSAVLTNVSVSTSGSTVAVTARPKGSVGGVLLRGVDDDDLPGV